MLLVLLFLFSISSSANHLNSCISNQTEIRGEFQRGGLILPSVGTINVLIIFAQFPDDNYEILSAHWPKNRPPSDMKNWVEESWKNKPKEGYLTHYYNEMSLNKLKLIGKEVSVTAKQSRNWYLKNNFQRGDIHTEIIKELDLSMDFAEFDRWNYISNYKQREEPDGRIDMIIFIWRNIVKDFQADSALIYQTRLNFTDGFGSIGTGKNFNIDNETREVFVTDFGSGVTLFDYAEDYIYGDGKRTRKGVVHEIGHYFLGHNDHHSGFGFWAMLSSWGIKSMTANSFERDRLGWIDLIEIKNTAGYVLRNAKLPDYITSGVAYVFKIDSASGEYFYIENHQNISYWEKEFKFGNIENGIYVLRKDKNAPSVYNDRPSSAFFRMIPADGRFKWVVNQKTKNRWGKGELPVFKKLEEDKINGYHDLDFIPWIWENKKQIPAVIHFVEDSYGNPIEDVKYRGDGSDAFRIGYKEEFNSSTNPNSQRTNKLPSGFGFKIKDFSDGIYSIDFFVETKK
jgi:hypothetical protein